MEAPSSSVVYCGSTSLLPGEGLGDALTMGPSNSRLPVGERVGGGPATRVNPKAGGITVCGWNGLAAADSVEFNCKAENRFWSSQRARLQFALSNLLHAVMISLASETLTHRTLQVVGYPIQEELT